MSDEVVIDALKTTVYELSCRVLERDDRIRELEQQNARLRERWEKLKRYISDESYDGDAAFNGWSIHIDRLRKWMKDLEAL